MLRVAQVATLGLKQATAQAPPRPFDAVCVCCAQGAFSAEASFTTPPAAGTATAAAAYDDDNSVRLLVAAGMGVAGDAGVAAQGSAEATLRQAALLATGQLPALGSSATRAMMQQLLDVQDHHGMLLLGGTAGAGQMETLLTRVPAAATPSEGQATSPQGPDSSSSSSSSSKCGVQAQWYSFNTGPVHVVMLDTEQSLKQGSPQYRCAEPRCRRRGRLAAGRHCGSPPSLASWAMHALPIN
jgi:hypothetical protein